MTPYFVSDHLKNDRRLSNVSAMAAQQGFLASLEMTMLIFDMTSRHFNSSGLSCLMAKP
jgi:hypothetical protein